MKRAPLFTGLIFSLLFAIGCSNSPNEPDVNDNELSDNEQMTILAAEIASDNGGVMADIEMATSMASGGTTAAAGQKRGMQIAGVDTTFTVGWVSYNLQLWFYNQDGNELPWYIEGRTDKIVYKSSLTGSNNSVRELLDITLNSSSNLTATDILSGMMKLNGSGTNNSSYEIKSALRSLSIAAASSFTIDNVVVDLSQSQAFPVSGTMSGTIAGKFTATGPNASEEQDYSFTFTISFSGGNTVKVTLPSGNSFTLDLATGEFSEA